MKRVLVVEDDPEIGFLLRTLIAKRLGCEVAVTADPEEALRVAGAPGVVAIVMDVTLGDARLNGVPCTGIDLTRILKANLATASIPVVLATAHAMRGDEERLLAQSGADAYVSKPFADQAKILGLIRTLIERAA